MWTAPGAAPRCDGSRGSGDPTAPISISAPARSISRRRLRALYLFYFRRVLPAIGRAVSKHRDAYTYLPESVLDFPDPDAFARRLEAAGFSNVGYEILTGGICALHHGTR